jgi:superfamily II DNA or RNA helicase
MTLLYIKYYNFNKILISVPSIILQEHWKNEIKKYFNNYKIIFVGGIKGKNKKKINEYFDKHKNLIIISTYASCKKILNYNIKFNFKVGDESHHLIGDNKEYNNFHNIKANKELYLTATMKELSNNSNVYSMDNIEQFGNIIDKKSINWAIKNKYIVDYDIVLIKCDIDIDLILKEINCNYIENKELLISAYVVLKSISLYNDLNNILVYTNTTDNADLVTKYIDILINTSTLFPELNKIKNQIHNKAYHSKKNRFDLKSNEVLKNKVIITSIVYSLGEGFNYSELNGVCFAENMMSNIRIIQSLLRPHRLDKNNPNKRAKVLIPFNINDLDYKKSNIYTISKQLRNEDENIKQRIKLIEIMTKKPNTNLKFPKTPYDIKIDNANELKKILIKLESSLNKYFKDLEEEYKYIKKINKKLKLESKKEYINNQEKHNNYIDNPREYFSTCWNNWYDFLGYDTEIFIQSKDDWIKFCKEKEVNNYNHYLELCKDFKELPKMPEEFYKDYTNFNNEFNLNRKRR